MHPTCQSSQDNRIGCTATTQRAVTSSWWHVLAGASVIDVQARDHTVFVFVEWPLRLGAIVQTRAFRALTSLLLRWASFLRVLQAHSSIGVSRVRLRHVVRRLAQAGPVDNWAVQRGNGEVEHVYTVLATVVRLDRARAPVFDLDELRGLLAHQLDAVARTEVRLLTLRQLADRSARRDHADGVVSDRSHSHHLPFVHLEARVLSRDPRVGDPKAHRALA
mmetsp:Transcript_36480/g.83664  ORF Transcript_36480/g.83664 Transcript_36480/m.83664 type:complete len:220 (-) Transcript_36480:1480-2139(-)